MIGLGFFTSARVAEQVRAGIGSLPRGQRWPATALGLTTVQTYRYVLLPMAFRIILPPLTSEFLNIIKNSSVALTIGLLELTGAGALDAGILVPGVRGLHRGDVLYLLINAVVVTAHALPRALRRDPRLHHGEIARMFSNFDFDVISRALPYLFYEGMTFTLTLTALATLGGIVFGTLLALMRLSGIKPLAHRRRVYVDCMRSHPAGDGDLLVLLPGALYRAWMTGAARPISVGAFASALITFIAVRGGVLLRDHARRHPVDPARAGLRAANALGHDLRADHAATSCCRRRSATCCRCC